MACLDNIIGLKDVCGTELIASNSGHYLNSLPGIGIEEINAALKQDYDDELSLINDLIFNAQEEIKGQVRAHLDTKHQLYSVIDHSVAGRYPDSIELQAVEANYLKGLRVKIYRNPHLSFFISEIKLKTQTTGNVDVFVYDLLQNKLLDTITVSCTTGEISTAEVYKEYASESQRVSLFIGYDATSVASFKTPINNSNCFSCNKGLLNDGYAQFYGGKIATGSDKILDNVESQDGSSGLSVTYSLQCSFDYFMCSIKNSLALPVKYKVGELLMEQLRYSKRINSIVNVYGADHSDLIDLYGDKVEFYMNQVFNNISIPNDRCFKCDKRAFTSVSI